MVKVLIEVSCEEEIYFERQKAFEMSPAEMEMIFKDKETGETVERIFFYDGEFTSFRR